jgi:P27 family predicted phage terminase small subunit
LRAADVDLIRRAAEWKDVYERAKNEVLSGGYFQTTQSGYTQVTAHFTVMEKAHAKLLEFEREFGFTLASSQKIVIPEANKENEFFD